MSMNVFTSSSAVDNVARSNAAAARADAATAKADADIAKADAAAAKADADTAKADVAGAKADAATAKADADIAKADAAAAKADATAAKADADIAKADVAGAKTDAAAALTAAQVAQTDAQVARTMAAQATSAVAPNSWFTGSAPAAGVTARGNGLSVVLPAGAVDIARHVDYTTDTRSARYAGANDTNIIANIDGTEPGLHIAVGGGLAKLPSWRQRHSNDIRGVLLVDNSTSPALSASTSVFAAWPAIHEEAGNEVLVTFIAPPGDVGGTPARGNGRIAINLTTGEVTTLSWSAEIAAIVQAPTANEVVVEANGDGSYSLVVEYKISGPGVSAGWFLYHCSTQIDAAWTGDGSDAVLHFTRPTVIANATQAPAISRAGGWEIADPAATGHVATLPLAVAIVAPSPTTAQTGVVEILGTNEAGGFLARLDVTAAGELRLVVSEDGGTKIATMTLPPGQWSVATEAEIALLIRKRRDGCAEAVVYINGTAVTGIGTTVPPAITAYATSLLAPTSATDATGLPDALDGGYRATTVAGELDAIKQLTGLSYVVLGAAQ